MNDGWEMLIAGLSLGIGITLIVLHVTGSLGST